MLPAKTQVKGNEPEVPDLQHLIGMIIAKVFGGGPEMKTLIATAFCMVALFATAIPIDAQTRRRSVENRTFSERRYNQRADSRYDGRSDRRYDRRYDDYRYDDRSVWERHRDKLTTAGGAAAGAMIGGLAGGKKGAIIGAIAGGGAAALYTYKIRDKDRDYRRY